MSNAYDEGRIAAIAERRRVPRKPSKPPRKEPAPRLFAFWFQDIGGDWKLRTDTNKRRLIKERRDINFTVTGAQIDHRSAPVRRIRFRNPYPVTEVVEYRPATAARRGR